MGYDEESSRPFLEVLFKPYDSWEIEKVCDFISE
jgi:hypothetical protein